MANNLTLAEKQTAQKKTESTPVKRGNLRMAPDDDQKKQNGFAHVLAFHGLAIEGQHHRGVDDARNIVRLLPFMAGAGTGSIDAAIES